MALNANMVEQLCRWCLKIDSLANTREAARRDFFGCDEPGEVHYKEGAGYPIIGERRFLGWFALTFKLPDGRHPAELAATAIVTGSDRTSTIDSIKGSRYILARNKHRPALQCPVLLPFTGRMLETSPGTQCDDPLFRQETGRGPDGAGYSGHLQYPGRD